MMIILRDDLVIEIFDSPDSPPDWIEIVDIQNEEYQFCDQFGQKYVGVVIPRRGFFGREQWQLRPESEPDVNNVLDLLDKAQEIEPNHQFHNLDSLREFVTSNIY